MNENEKGVAYSALKAAGHSPAKAAEIILDAKRDDQRAKCWIRAVMEAQG